MTVGSNPRVEKLGMAQEVEWTRQQQANTLAAIDVVRELLGGGAEYGPADFTHEVLQHVRGPDDLADLVAGLANFAAMVIEQFSTVSGIDRYEILKNAANVVEDVAIID